MMSKIIITGIFCFFSLPWLVSQTVLPEYIITKRTYEGILVKWEPRNTEEFRLMMTQGTKVSLLTPNGELLISKWVKPISIGNAEEKIKVVSAHLMPFYQGSFQLLYPEIISDNDQRLDKVFSGQNAGFLDSLKIGLMVYSALYDMILCEDLGLGVTFEGSFQNASQVKIEIGNQNYKSNIINKREANIPNITGKWGNKHVEMSWETSPTRNEYYGFIIQRSEDGVHFIQKDSIPHINNIINKDGTQPLLTIRDSFPQNYKTYYYRVLGFDYFGQYSKQNNGIVGYGFEEMQLSPMISFADQSEDNKAHIKWEIMGTDVHLLSHFTLFRADSTNGKFTKVLDSIHRDNRELLYPLTHATNYFRIEATPKDGEGRSSIPVLIMGQDNDPPAKPEVISAILQKDGKAVITWKKNIENDLWGYRIFKSNFHNDEFSLLNANPQIDTVFTDSLNFKLGTKYVYYQIEASDKRNNISPRSDTIRLTIPDVIPPDNPIITKLEQKNDTISIHFFPSSSEDKKYQTIYRREIYKEESWTKIAVLDNLYVDSFYLDLIGKMEGNYAYTMTATDETDLESVPVAKKEIYLKKPKEVFQAFKKIDQKIDSVQNTITLSWECNEEQDLEGVLVYRGVEKEKMGRYKIVDSPDMFITDAYNQQEKMFYVLKPIYKSHPGDFRSDYIVVELPKNSKRKIK